MAEYEDSLDRTGIDAAGTLYEHDFYSGSQIGIMIGDVFIDTAISLAYTVEQTRTPVFGYANQYYSFVSDGHVIVKGHLVVAFKEAGYLLAPIQRFLNKVRRNETTSPRYRPSDNTTYATPRGMRKDPREDKIIRQNVEQSFENVGSSRDWRSQQFDFWNELGRLEDDKFEDWAEAFEDKIWHGTDTNNPFERDKVNSKNASLYDVQFNNKTILSHRRADQYPAVDIWITYGDINNRETNHTVRKIMDVSFLGTSQTIEISGTPVFETYSFMARNVV